MSRIVTKRRKHMRKRNQMMTRRRSLRNACKTRSRRNLYRHRSRSRRWGGGPKEAAAAAAAAAAKAAAAKKGEQAFLEGLDMLYGVKKTINKEEYKKKQRDQEAKGAAIRAGPRPKKFTSNSANHFTVPTPGAGSISDPPIPQYAFSRLGVSQGESQHAQPRVPSSQQQPLSNVVPPQLMYKPGH